MPSDGLARTMMQIRRVDEGEENGGRMPDKNMRWKYLVDEM